MPKSSDDAAYRGIHLFINRFFKFSPKPFRKRPSSKRILSSYKNTLKKVGTASLF